MSNLAKLVVVVGFFTTNAISVIDKEFGRALTSQVNDYDDPWESLMDPGAASPKKMSDAITSLVDGYEALAEFADEHEAAIGRIFDLVSELKARYEPEKTEEAAASAEEPAPVE